MRCYTQHGLTLLELLLVLTLIGLILHLSYANYSQHLLKTRRLAAQMTLLELAARLESYYADHQTYTAATFEKLGMNSQRHTAFYELEITHSTSTSYYLRAIPLGAQLMQDKLCGTLMLNQVGEKAQTGPGTTAECWQA